MTKILAAVLLAAASFQVFSSELIIGKGEEFVVKPDQMSMAVDKLVVGDNATIRFAEGVDHWELLAKDATIGRGVIIDGSGRRGADGAPGKLTEQSATVCRSGKSGDSGEAGENGSPGVDIYLGLDARKIGKLQVIADGGTGGAGGSGGRGQDAGRMLNCPAARGGNGGIGGPGGDGGRGGNVVISVSSLDPKVEVGALTAGVRVSVKPGVAGKGGEGGDGGVGSEGQYVSQKTLTGSRKWVSGGPGGRFGAKGEDGQEGDYGRVFVGGQFEGFPPASTQGDGYDGFDKYRTAGEPSDADGDKTAAEEIQLLREQLRVLQERVESLEK
ncbi:MAG: hypothetical protein WC997_06405 [Porticoccaceae bacterium]